jgi:uncharacterized membrane protein
VWHGRTRRSAGAPAQCLLGLDPAAAPFIPPTGPQGIRKLERIGGLSQSPLQTLLTAASMVACINAIVGGVTVALAVRWLLDGSVPVAAVIGAAVAMGLATLFLLYQIRRFRRATAVVPEPCTDPGGVSTIPVPTAIEQADPGGVSCTMCISSLTRVSWSTATPSCSL